MIILAGVLTVVCVILWQLLIDLTLEKKPISCGGDWSYGVSCPMGATCVMGSINPLAGGTCQSYAKAAVTKLTKPTTTTVVVIPGAASPPVEKITEAEVLSTSCKIKITTNTKSFELLTMIYKNSPQGTVCHQSLRMQISLDGKYLAFTDVDGGLDLALALYSLDRDKTYPLDVFGSAHVVEFLFVDAQTLLAMTGITDDFGTYALTAYNLDTFFKNNAATTKEAVGKVTRLPDIGDNYYNLVVVEDKVTVSGRDEKGTKTYDLNELLPKRPY